MTRSTIGTIVVLLVAAVVAFRLGGTVGVGVIAGVLCGCSVSALGGAWQRHVFRTRPKKAFNAVLETFLFKLAFVIIGAISFRYIDAAAARVNWKSFLVSFVFAVLVVHTLTVLDNVRLLLKKKAPLENDSPLADSPLK